MMISKISTHHPAGFLQFSPYLAFIYLYITLYCYIMLPVQHIQEHIYTSAKLPFCAAFLATIYAFFTFSRKYSFDKKFEIFIHGITEKNVIENYCILIALAMYHTMIAHTNGLLTATTICLLYIPTHYMMVYVFLIPAMIQLCVHSIKTTAIICMPIAYGIAVSLEIPPAYMGATIISGALYGHHMSLFFNEVRYAKFRNTIVQSPYISTIVAGIVTVCMLAGYTCQALDPAVYHHIYKNLLFSDYVTIIPYIWIILIGPNIRNSNFFVTLMIANFLTLLIGVVYHHMTCIDTLLVMLTGFCQDSIIFYIFLFYFTLTGLKNIIQYNHGFDYIHQKIYNYNPSYYTEAHIVLIVDIIINNALSIIDTMSMYEPNFKIKAIQEKYNISSDTIMTLSEIVITIIKTILPYSFTMFITLSINHSLYYTVLYYIIYPYLVVLCMLISIPILHNNNKK